MGSEMCIRDRYDFKIILLVKFNKSLWWLELRSCGSLCFDHIDHFAMMIRWTNCDVGS